MKARSLEGSVDEHNSKAQRLRERHHHFAVSVTLFQIAVALCAIAALTKRNALWSVALAASAVGLALFVIGFATRV